MLRQKLRQLRKFKLKRQEEQQAIGLVKENSSQQTSQKITNHNLLTKLESVNKVIKTPTDLHLKNVKNIPVSDDQVYVDLIRLPKSPGDVVLHSNPKFKNLLQQKVNSMCCPGCLSTILVACGPPNFPYLLQGVEMKTDYSIDLIKRRTVSCSSCKHEVGFEWAQTLYLKT